jgi:hypothetical protein
MSGHRRRSCARCGLRAVPFALTVYQSPVWADGQPIRLCGDCLSWVRQRVAELLRVQQERQR